MKSFIQILFIVSLTLTIALSQKEEDDKIPYEFGFTVDGEQHRHEKKDVRGIIEGEFGFITADGVYHVTVYATDENGKFKILSMRNLQISAPLDGSPLRAKLSPEADKYRKKAGLQALPQAAAAKTAPNPLAVPQYVPEQQLVVTTPKNQAPFKFTTQATVKPACASCGFVTTPKPKPGVPGNGFQFQNPVFQQQDNQRQQQTSDQSGPLSGGPLSIPIPISSPGQLGGVDVYQSQEPQNTQSIGGQQQNSQYSGNNLPQYHTANGPQNTHYNTFRGDQNLGGGIEDSQYPGGNQGPTQYPGGGPEGIGGGAQYSDYTGVGGQQNIGGNNGGFGGPGAAAANPLLVPEKSTEVSSFPPVSVSDGVIHVGGKHKQDIAIKDKFPGMQDGLPDGVDEKDITDLLYKFHYTVGFHGHYEKGLKNGAKVGGYFVNGRDGISRVVTYIADENGYRPKVKFINLGLSSEKTPKEETEKTFGLESFEFVWYPIE